MNSECKLLFDLLKFELTHQTTVDKDIFANKDVLEKIFDIAAQHSLVSIFADALYKQNIELDQNTNDVLKQFLFQAVCQYQEQCALKIKIEEAFEQNQIKYIMLKGAFLRDYYPEPWLRTSRDIDVLIMTEDLERASKLVEKCGCIYDHRDSHDISYVNESGICIELHFDLIESQRKFANVSEVLADVWKDATLKPNHNFEYEMSNEMFCFYHIAHMLKHFINGGCGIKTFLDLKIINDRIPLNSKKLETMLQNGKISKFSNTVIRLSEIWFGNLEHDEITKIMEDYIIDGGVYGSVENSISMNRAKGNNSIKTVMSKIFMNYNAIKYQYPVLQKHKWLLPYYEVKRWCKLIFVKEHRIRSSKFMASNQKIDNDLIIRTKNLKDYLEI